MKKKCRDKGALALRVNLLHIRYLLEAAQETLDLADRNAKELGVVDQLAIATKALRSIANYSKADGRSKGVAKGALAKMEVKS